MSETSFLSKVIRQVNKTTNVNLKTEKLVIIDNKTGVYTDKKNFFGINQTFYLVSNNNDPTNIGEHEISYKIRNFDLELELSITYSVSCNQGSEEKMAQALHSQDSVENEMDRIVQKSIARFIHKNDTIDFVNNFYDRVSDLTKFVKESVQDEIGTYIELRIFLNLEKKLKSFPISSVQFGVFVKDCSNELKISIETELIIDKSNKIKAILNYGRDLLLLGIVKEVVKDYFFKNIDLHKFCYELKTNIRDEILEHLNKVLRDYGRQLTYLSLDNEIENELKPFPIKIFQLEVSLKDCNDELKIFLGTELIVDELNKAKAILNYGRELLLVDIVKKEVKNYFYNYINMHRFCYELKHNIRNELLIYLNEVLCNYGRQLKSLSLESDAATPGNELLDNRSYDIECAVQGYSQKVLVKNRLCMKPEDMGKYRLADSPDLENWVEEKLKSIIQPLLLQTEYVHLLTDFSSVAETIKARMLEAASKIGYQITHLISSSDIEAKLREDLNLENLNLNIEKEDFYTKDPRVQVSLNVVVNAKITNLIEIKDYLSQEMGIKKLMEESITSTVREYLNQIEPDRFYMRFYQYSEEMNEKKSVEEELKEAIKEVLEKSFFAQVSSIVPKPCDTKITEHYRDLNKEIHSFDCTVNSLKSSIQTTITGDFVVQAVEKDSWHTFQSREPKKDQIKQSIERSLEAHLNTYGNSLQYVDNENRKKIEEDIKKIVKDNIIDQYGLEINISNFTRQLTSLEKKKEEYLDNINTLYIDVQNDKLERIKEELKTNNKEVSNLRSLGYEENEDEINTRKKYIKEAESVFFRKKIDLLEPNENENTSNEEKDGED
jgi:hypothetical protein